MPRINQEIKIGRVPSTWRLRNKNKRAQDHRQGEPEEEKPGKKRTADKMKKENHLPPGPVNSRKPRESFGDDPPQHVDIRV